MIIKSFNKNSIKALVILVVVSLCAFLVILNSSATNITVEDFNNPDLQFAKIKGAPPAGMTTMWDSDGTLTQSQGKYTLKTNSYACWFLEDNIDFGYKKVLFNYGKDANLTIETTITSWNGAASTASAGIMIRSSLNNNSAAVFFGPRPAGIYQLYRYKDGGKDGVAFAKGPIIDGQPSYPIAVKMVLNSSKVTCYYRYNLNGAWIKTAAAVPFQYTGDSIYVGIAAHTSDQNDLATAVFNGVHITTDAPDGYTPGGGDPTGNTTNDNTPKLPEDLPVTPDVLLRETFTDGDMFNTFDSEINPIWKKYAENPNIVSTPDYTNRYLSMFYTDDGYYVAGNQLWTDYSTALDITFPNDYLPEEENTFKLLLRHQSIPQYGFNDYAIIFTKGNKLQIGTRSYAGNIETIAGTIVGQYTILKEISYNYLADANTHRLRVDTLDNVITVYMDGVKLMDVVDKSTVINATGAIGFGVKKGNVIIDNITVRKLSDPVGGDYDNAIGGNFNTPIPDYLKEYSSKNWSY